MGRAGRGGGEGEAGQGRLGGADWSKCEVGQGEVPRVVKWANSRPLDLWSWQMALEISLCWFVSILLMTLLMLVVALLQKLESNNDTLSLSLLFGAHRGWKWSAVARGLDVSVDQHFVQAGVEEGCNVPKKVGKLGTMEEDGAGPLARPGNLDAGSQGWDLPGSGNLLQVCVLNPTLL